MPSKALFFSVIVFCLSLNPFSLEGKHPKLLLHVDVNKTLIAEDSANGTTVEQTLNALLAKHYRYKWIPELKAAISYEDYVENYLLPGPSFIPNLKQKRKELLHQFVSYLQACSHPLEEEVVTVYHELLTKIEETCIFPSFLKMIEKLKAEDIPYTLILRTFGTDTDLAKRAYLRAFPEDIFCAQGYFMGGKLYAVAHNWNLSLFTCWDMYLFFKSLTGHVAIQDNWKEWSSHLGNRKYGKKFPINLEDPETLSLFFDDNIREDPHSKVNIVDPVDARSGRQLSITELLEHKFLFHVDTFEALRDDHYFIELVEQSLRMQLSG